ncbi:MAG TPA: THUMP domain-containing protein, partial [Anaerovoracaceae bacterium]|nr:THUMP domain-containing protein [Anaerovoracaceae bacterium]
MIEERNTFIVRCGEVALKGLNKPYFERMLVDRIKRSLKKYDGVEVKRNEGLIFVRALKELDSDKIVADISRVFGVASISPAIETASDMDEIGQAAVEYMLRLIEKKGVKTFKVDAKRADKNFPIKSPDIAKIIGAKVLIGCKVLKVDVHHPDCLLFVDVRRDKSYIYEQKISGFGGL